MGIEQIPGDCPLKLVKGDDLLISFNIPFDATGYIWNITIHHVNEGEILVPYITTVQSSVLTILQTNFYSSITTLLDSTFNGNYHTWKIKYIDPNSIIRTFITGNTASMTGTKSMINLDI